MDLTNILHLFKFGVKVIIKKLSNNQHHLVVGDGVTEFLNKNATVKSVEDEKVYVQIEGFDYTLWFHYLDLEII